MTANGRSSQDDLGGRLPLLDPAELSGAQRELYEKIRRSRVASAERSGYTAALADGRVVGPFNAFLHAPALGAATLNWAGQVGEALERSAITATVREIVILTVAASRQSSYAGYAHRQAASRAGVDAAVIDAIQAGRTPGDLPPDQAAAHQLAARLAVGNPVDEATYTAAVTTFGVDGVMALVCLVGQYLTTCAVLSCFDVPAPDTL